MAYGKFKTFGFKRDIFEKFADLNTKLIALITDLEELVNLYY